MPPTVDCMAPSILRAASLTAARTRSCSISTSPAFTASGSMRRLSNCLRPSILAVTVPPPAEASTTVSCIFFCRFAYCACAFDISSCRLNPPIGIRLLAPAIQLSECSCNRKPEAALLPFLSVINHRPNFRAEFFAHALHYGILLSAAATSESVCAVSSRARRPTVALVCLSCNRCAGNDFQLHCPAQNSAGRGDGQAPRFRTDRHVDDRLRCGNFDYQFVGLYAPLASFKHGDQDALVAVAQRLQDGGLQAFQRGF